MIGRSTFRLTFTLVTCLAFLSRGFVIDKRILSQDIRNFEDFNHLNNYDDEDYEDELLKNTYYNNNRGLNAMSSNKREFSPDKLRQQVREKMEAIIRGKDVSGFIDEDVESEMFDSMLRKMTKDNHEAMKNLGNLKSSSSFREEQSSQTKIESSGNKGVAVVTGQSMESSSSGNGSNPLVKVAKVIAVATKDGKENGEWKMKPIEEEIQVITPAPEDGKQTLKKDDDDDDAEEKFKSLFERGSNGRFIGGRDFDRLFDAEEVERGPRSKRSIFDAEESKKSGKDVDLLKNYIALQDAENRHLMQALDLASEIELNNEEDPRTIDEQMYHMRKALEEERALSAIRKQIQLSIKNSGVKRNSYFTEQNDFPAEDMKKYAAGGDDYDNGIDYSFLERYSKRRDSGIEDDNDDGDDGGDDDADDDDGVVGESMKEDEDGNLMEEWAGDITLDRHKLRNEELIDRLKEMMSQSDEGWQSISRSKKPRLVDLSDDVLLDEESLRNLLRSYRKNYKTLDDDQVFPLIFPGGDKDYDEEDIDPQLRKKILENMARHSLSGYRLNPFFRNITKVEFPEKRFFQETRPMVSSSDEDVENTEPWCLKAAKLVDNCLYARLNGLLPDSEAVDLCNAHQLCYKCGSSNGVTSEECDRAFMERSKELCLDEMACKKQAASLYVTMMADRQFYTDFEAPDVCTDPCVISILYTDRAD